MSTDELNYSEKIVAIQTTEGMSTEEIADFLGVTPKHIDNIKRKIRRLMQIDDPREAALKAKERGLLEGI